MIAHEEEFPPSSSRSAWKRVYENPADDAAWRHFHKRYWDVMFRWALARTGDPALADEVATDVFGGLYRRIRGSGSGRVEPDEDGSFRPYIKAAVGYAVADCWRRRSAEKRAELSVQVLERLEAPDSVAELGRSMAEREILERSMARFAARLREALTALREDPQYDPQSLAIALRVHRGGEKAAEVDRSTGMAAGHASKTATRVLDRLVHLMDLRVEVHTREAARTVVMVLLKDHDGDLG